MARMLFVQNFWFEFLGTMYLSAVLKEAGHTCRLVIERRFSDIEQELAEFQPDLVGFYVTTGSHRWALDTAARIKERFACITVVGGPHPTFFPEIVSHPAIDIVCRGEGETALRLLAERIDQCRPFDNIPNLWIHSHGTRMRNEIAPLIENLDTLPFPDREIYYQRYSFLRTSPSKHFITGRGCPYTCSFCCNKAYNELHAGKGSAVRRLSAPRVIDEIRRVTDCYPLRAVRFDDEVFLLRKDWLRVFLALYREEIGIPYSCLIRADLMDEEMAQLLARSGCYTAHFGVESGSDPLRNRVLGKHISREEIVSTALLLHKYGIKAGTFNMLGVPGEGLDEAYQTVELNQLIRADYPWCSIVQPYPRTDLLDYCIEHGYLDQEFSMETFSESYFNRSVIHMEHGRELTNLHKFFYLAVRVPWLFPLIKRLIRLPANPIFDAIFSITFSYRYIKTYRVSAWRWIRSAFLLRERY